MTGIWANTIGVEQEMGANTAIEDSLHAPGGKGGSRRSEKQQRAQELVAACEWDVGRVPHVAFGGLVQLSVCRLSRRQAGTWRSSSARSV